MRSSLFFGSVLLSCVLAGFSYVSSARAASSNEPGITSSSGADLPIGAASESAIWVKQDQSVLISKTNREAMAKLDVNGSIRIGIDPDPSTCTTGTDRGGTMAFFKKNSTDTVGSLWLCDGTKWVCLSCSTNE